MATKKAKTTASKKTTAKKTTAKKPVAKKTTDKKTVSAKAVVAKKNDKKQVEFPTPSALIAECLGTFVLTGAFITLFGGEAIAAVAIALTMAAIVVIFGVMSGAHFNPATTIALWANRKISGVKAALYILAQCFGALVAFFVFRAIFAAANGFDMFASSDALVIDQLVTNYASSGITEDVISEAGGLSAFATSNGFASVAEMVKQLNFTTFPENVIAVTDSMKGVALAATELVASIIFGLGAGFAYLKKNKPIVKAVALGFALLAALVIGGDTVIANPAIAAALGSFTSGWFGVDGLSGAALANNIIWPLVTYLVITIAGVLIGMTAYRYMMKDSKIEEAETCERDICCCKK